MRQLSQCVCGGRWAGALGAFKPAAVQLLLLLATGSQSKFLYTVTVRSACKSLPYAGFKLCSFGRGPPLERACLVPLRHQPMVRRVLKGVTPACLLMLWMLLQELHERCAPIVRAPAVQELSRTIGLVHAPTGRLVSRHGHVNNTRHHMFSTNWRCC